MDKYTKHKSCTKLALFTRLCSYRIIAYSISTMKMSHLKNINFTYHKLCIQYNKHKVLSQSSTSVTHHIRSQLFSFLPSSASENILSYDHRFLLLVHHPHLYLGLIRILYHFITLTGFSFVPSFLLSFLPSFVHSFIHSIIFSFFLPFFGFCHEPTSSLRYRHISTSCYLFINTSDFLFNRKHIRVSPS